MTRLQHAATDALAWSAAWLIATGTLLAAFLFFISRGLFRFCIRQWRGLSIVALALIGARLAGFI